MDIIEIEQKVRAVIVEQFNLPREEITLSTSLRDDLGADSMALVELASRLEECFGVRMPDVKRLASGCVGDVVGLLATFLSEPSHATAA